MKIYVTRKGERTYFVADLGMLNGKRVRKNFTSEAKARAFLATKKRERMQYGRAALELDDETRREFMHHRDRLQAAGATLQQAVDFYLASRPARRISLRDAIDQALAEKQTAGRRRRYLDRLRSTWGQFEDAHPKATVDEITGDTVTRWLASRPLSARTRHSKLTAVTVLFTWAKKRGYTATNPCEQVEPIDVDWRPPAILTPEECRKLLDTAAKVDPGLVPYFALALFAGIRPNEIQRLTWQAVDLDAGHVTIDPEAAKTRQRRLVPLNDAARAWLALGGDIPPRNMDARRVRIAEAAGITWTHDVLRHTAASYLLAIHQDAGKVSLWLGNSPTILFRHYRELVKPADAQAWLAIRPARKRD